MRKSYHHLPIVDTGAVAATHRCRHHSRTMITPSTCAARKKASPCTAVAQQSLTNPYWICRDCEGPIPLEAKPMIQTAPATYHCNTCDTDKPIIEFFPSCSTKCKDCLRLKNRKNNEDRRKASLTGETKVCHQCKAEYEAYKHGCTYPSMCRECFGARISKGVMESKAITRQGILINFDLPRDEKLMEALKARARKNRRDLLNEIIVVLEEACQANP